jgi:hypothetical protein
MSSVNLELYFRVSHGGSLIFAPPERALYIDQLHRAIEESKTWGEFRKRLPPGEYRRLFAESFSADPGEADKEFQEPTDSQQFSSEDVPGYSEGDYPPWLATEQDVYLPQEILKQFGRRETSAINGGFWNLKPAHRDLIIERLTGLGYKVEEREDLKFW